MRDTGDHPGAGDGPPRDPSRGARVRRDPRARDTSAAPVDPAPPVPPKAARDQGFSYLDAAAGPLVRPYTMTGGRTRPVDTGLDMISVVVATRRHVDQVALEPEHASILDLCRRPVSVAEISAHLDIPLTVVKVLLSDLISKGDVLARAPLPAAELPQMNVLQAVLDGIRRL
ncbi:hypothetical protein HDA32_001687 [Spinactinospora alkalitolerans]|uniref:DUF742 domain-containing protein n=1 Tax=Spinactinospora alkalitolerans TaxID=687207 RepID=A0A852TTD9_9ACTN|nr:DUF742 domain-containing protein [Spinactinospora alkalitolerans]NYE46567.1 hypothetical protein [Spinactinospora alkalitolerans]